MNNVDQNRIILEEKLKHNCCNGEVYYDGRCGDSPIFIHDKNCPVGKRQKLEDEYWSMDSR